MEKRVKFPIKSTGIFATGVIAGYIGSYISRKALPMMSVGILNKRGIKTGFLPVIPEFDENITGFDLSSQLMNRE
ncbi:hypothetical protein DYD21_15285 [Rhodohalobacter sp. SW132]|uniref:hypothetical protein n=1 Tax=Rhodohalobacter sp. SW132 TaxID=2293433 RepID=UPI000E2457F6|nr:hypothetical protein [Rhodohalobacter sp. SW132]REL29209.1 hypothetical protein DYD21_15285 [Rhodohalobacter sp. SW132]